MSSIAKCLSRTAKIVTFLCAVYLMVFNFFVSSLLKHREGVSKETILTLKEQINCKHELDQPPLPSKKHTPFTWDMLDPSIPGLCGHTKCFFRAKSDPEKIGYAISSYHPNTMQWAWSKTLKLSRYYGVRHIYLEPPQSVRGLSEALVDVFKTRKRENHKQDTMHQSLNYEEFIHLAEATIQGEGQQENSDKFLEKMIVQKLHVVPSPFLEIGHGMRRVRKVEEGWNAFCDSICNKTLFSKRLLEEERSLAELLEKEIWLRSGFQILIDNQGRIIHFDLDRGYESEIKINSTEYKKVENYLSWIREIAIDVLSNSTVL